MDSYVAVPLVACVVSALVASRTWFREPDNAQMWPIAGLSGLAAGWAFCEVLWHQADGPDTALLWARLTSLATVPLGPVALHALAVASDVDSPRFRRLLRLCYAACLPLLAAALFTEGVIEDVVATGWGWSPVPGPLLAVQYAATMVCVGIGFAIFRSRMPIAQASHLSPLVTLSVAIPLVLISITDVILPALDIHAVPRAGAASLAFIAGLQTFVVYRRGEDSLLPAGVTGAVLRALPDGVVSATLDGRIRSANARFAALVGDPAEELIGGALARYLPALPLAGPNAAMEARDVECQLITSGGERIDVSVSTSLREVAGSASGRVLIVRDLREVAALRKRLLLSGRMAAVGELAAGIAHELNNPLAYLRSNLATLRSHGERVGKELRQLPHWPELRELAADCEAILDESLEGVERATSVVREVRDFSHAGHAELRPTRLADVIEHSVRIARLQIRKTVAVELDLPSLPEIDANAQRLGQVIVNLLVNAGHAVGAEGRIRIAAESEAGWVTLRLCDDGCGIAADDLDRIFDPFFTTKPVGVGTGLGLAIAFGIVQEHGGSIDAESEPGRGTEFRIRLPIHQPPAGSGRSGAV